MKYIITFTACSLVSLTIMGQYIDNEPNTVQGGAHFNIGGYGTANHFRTVQAASNHGNVHLLMMQTPGVYRWGLGTRTEEGGGGSGSNFSMFAYADDGNYLAERLTINRSNGFMGITEGNPQASLHVGSFLSQPTAIKIGKLHDVGNINVPLGAACGGYNIDFYGWRDMYVDQVGARIRAERINNYAPNNALIRAMDVAFSTSSGGDIASLTEKMRITWDGKVGIGTSKPQHELSVKGTIGAKKVRVTQDGWADYVFEDGYQLRSIPELEFFIKQHKRLPDIPAASEVATDGIDLGEMNRKLLQKIEELTLYMIEQQKQIDGLRREVDTPSETATEGVDVGEMNKRLVQKVEELSLDIMEQHKNSQRQQAQIDALLDAVKELKSSKI
ncbi:hypothetical protein MKQ68_10430 [Chitinophaga horti]|uniref:Tail fiber domain-containing protein n=1 Tax=Chitinophaga horti TaxID=2920382 RepID=A0ABY6JB43_9BACT|nr:hypothetical protein [Chitinophaga horti]UYQ95516.1 hypothetical protein MKQ68_10430 [Chitinophaga horti]